jgi:uncharacterized small protein (DUF1192 family)
VEETTLVAKPTTEPNQDRDLYALYDELDRLEELLEDMANLGVTSVEDAERRIAALNERIDELEAAEVGNS